MRHARPRGDGGESLIELLMAILIMGVTVVAVVGGLATSVLMSDVHRKQALATAQLRSYGEFVNNSIAAGSGYRVCATPTGGATPYPAFTPSAGYTASVTEVRYWNGTAFPPPAGTCSASVDIGVQQLTLEVRSTDGRAVERMNLVVRRP